MIIYSYIVKVWQKDGLDFLMKDIADIVETKERNIKVALGFFLV